VVAAVHTIKPTTAATSFWIDRERGANKTANARTEQRRNRTRTEQQTEGAPSEPRPRSPTQNTPRANEQLQNAVNRGVDRQRRFWWCTDQLLFRFRLYKFALNSRIVDVFYCLCLSIPELYVSDHMVLLVYFSVLMLVDVV